MAAIKIEIKGLTELKEILDNLDTAEIVERAMKGVLEEAAAEVQIRATKPQRTLIFKTLDGLCEEMSKPYVIHQIRKWIISQDK